MRPLRRFPRRASHREYADKIADAMGEDCSGDDARGYARGSAPLHLFVRKAPGPRSTAKQPDVTAHQEELL